MTSLSEGASTIASVAYLQRCLGYSVGVILRISFALLHCFWICFVLISVFFRQLRCLVTLIPLPPSSCRGSPSVVSLLLAALFFLLAFPSAKAQTIRLWSNAPASSNWNNASDWSGGTIPSAGNLLEFSNSTITSLTNDFTAGTSFSGLLFTTGASAYTISGNQIALTGGITNNSTVLETIKLAISDTSLVTLTTTSGGGNLQLGGVISGSGTLSIAGSGTTTLTASNTYSGGTTLNAGTLAISNNAALGTGTVTFTGNSTLAALASLGITNNEVISNGVVGTLNSGTFLFTNSGVISGAGSLGIAGTGTTILTGSNTYTGTTTVDGGGSTLMVNAGSINSTSLLTVGSNTSGNTLILTNGGVVDSLATYEGNNTSSSNNLILVTGVGSLLSNSSSLFIGYQGSGNSFVISNGAVVDSSITFEGRSTTSSNNSILVTGSNSLLSSSSYLYIGDNGSSNSLVISNGGVV